MARDLVIRKRGRPEFEPTAEQRKLVEQMAALGIPHDDMITCVLKDDGKPITVVTLKKHFERELAGGKTRATVQMGGRLFRKGFKEGDTTAMIFWLKTRAGWKETRVTELGGIDGKPIETTQKPTDLSALSDDEIEAFHTLLAKLGGGKG